MNKKTWPRKEAIAVFNEHTEEYDRWYHEKPGASLYEAEVKAVKALISGGSGLEVGVGTGIFASRLNVQIGVDPAQNMLRIAKKRGVDVIQGTAEFLPIRDKSFDYVLSILTICFLEDIDSAFREAWRVLRYGGSAIICFIPRDSYLGSLYLRKKAEGHKFYKYANLYAKEEVEKLLYEANFQITENATTLSESGLETKGEESYNNVITHGFVCIKAKKIQD
ncbi:MAG: class I SAM-dependent methyltransferase [Candidatus Heimdallarchaeota archaeon]